MKAKSGVLGLISILALLVYFGAPSSACGNPSDWTSEQLLAAFDEVARNYGAIEYATYTYMTEFSAAPKNIDELRESGHLNVQMTNPYTGGEVLALVRTDNPEGDILGNVGMSIHDDGREVRVETWFLRRDDTDTMYQRSMLKRMSVRVNTVDRGYFFENENPRDEQMVAVYCKQAIDAIESFIQRNGRTPEDFVDMYNNGDVNVHYINPVTGELMMPSDDLSAGDYTYRKIGEEGYTLIGWGREEPVFFATTDENEELAFYVEWPQLLLED